MYQTTVQSYENITIIIINIVINIVIVIAIVIAIVIVIVIVITIIIMIHRTAGNCHRDGSVPALLSLLASNLLHALLVQVKLLF